MLVSSKRDIASLNIGKKILEQCNFQNTATYFMQNPIYEAKIGERTVRLVTLTDEMVYAQNLADLFTDLELIIFISRHSSTSGTPTLSVHTPGNLSGKAELGGLPKKVSVSPANAMKDALKSMAKHARKIQLKYEVSYECTHHGPSLNVPTMFAELGSAPAQWNDLDAANVVAQAVLEAISKFGKSNEKAVLGIGGPHYNLKFTRMCLEENVAFGHIIPKYAIPWIDAEILQQCLERTLEKTYRVILDWKGIRGEDKPKLVKLLEQVGVSWEKV